MHSRQLNRREFLKLLALPPLVTLGSALPKLGVKPLEDQQRPNFLILVFDTFSAPHMTLLGYPRNTTPNFSRFAQRATVFHRHYSGGNFTMPGTASLLTGVPPWAHRGLHLYGRVAETYADRNIFSAMGEDYFTSVYTHNPIVQGMFDQFERHLDQFTPMGELAILSEALSERIFPNDFMLSFWGERLLRGSGSESPASLFLSLISEDFDSFTPEDLKQRYKDQFPLGLPNNTVGSFFILEDAMAWIREQALNLPRPYLAYYHLFPPHEPYMTRREFVGRFNDSWKPEPKPVLIFHQNRSEAYLNDKRRQYDEYIAYVDAEFGRLYDFLEGSGALENTYLIVTSDHGQLMERKIHGHVTGTLYEPLVRIPLFIASPGQTDRQDIYTPTSCLDVLPTVAHLAGKPAPEWCEGTILPGLGGEPQEERSLYVLEAKKNPRLLPITTGSLAWRQGRYKLISYFGYPGVTDDFELYDLENDPEEREDLYTSRKGLAAEMSGALMNKLDEINRLPIRS